MSGALSNEILNSIFQRLKLIFSDLYYFDSLIAEPLLRAILDSNMISINTKTTKKIAERYFNKEDFKTNELKLKWIEIQIVFKTCYVLIYSYYDYPKSLMWNNTSILLENYPEFQQYTDVDHLELELLLNFRNMLVVTLLLIPARLNKQSILKIAARLEGSQNEYITGGGQKPAVTRRVRIYEKEGNIPPTRAPYHSINVNYRARVGNNVFSFDAMNIGDNGNNNYNNSNNDNHQNVSNDDNQINKIPKTEITSNNQDCDIPIPAFYNNDLTPQEFDELMSIDIYDATFSDEIDLSMMGSLL